MTPQSQAALIADRLHSVAIHLLRQLRKEDDASGLSAPRLSALSVVVFGGPLSLGNLARAEQVKPPTMTRIVTGLERDGLVTRQGALSDRRLTLIGATPRGKKVLVEGRARRVEKLSAALDSLGNEERVQLERGVQIVENIVTRMRTPERRRATIGPRKLRSSRVKR